MVQYRNCRPTEVCSWDNIEYGTWCYTFACIMRVFKTRWFQRWATKEKLSDKRLRETVDEIRNGLVEADLGGHVLKKRIAQVGRGKRGSVRTLIVFKQDHHCFFVYGFLKNERDNIDAKELKSLRRLAHELLGYDAGTLRRALEARELIELETNDGG